MNHEIHFDHVGPHFLVADVSAAAEFYSTSLGFEVDYVDGSPPHYAVVCRDEVYLHLSLQGPKGFPEGPGCAFVAVTEVELLWARISSTATEVVEPLADRDYDQGVRFRVFTIRDPDRNVLRIGEIR